MSRLLWCLAAASVLILAPGVEAQRPPIVAAASSLNFALKAVADRFTRDSGERLVIAIRPRSTERMSAADSRSMLKRA